MHLYSASTETEPSCIETTNVFSISVDKADHVPLLKAVYDLEGIRSKVYFSDFFSKNAIL